MKIKKFIDKIVHNNIEKDMDCLSEMLEKLICDLKHQDYEKYIQYKFKLHKLAYGNTLTDEQAEHWVRSMKNVSKKETGEHWTKNQTNEVMKKMGYECDENAFYVIMNYMYSIYCGIVSDSVETYAKMSYNWLKEENNDKDKLISYYYFIVK